LAVSVGGLPAEVQPEAVSEGAVREGRRLALGPNGFAFLRDEGGAARVSYRRRVIRDVIPAKAGSR
jgi:hypothetical protein